MSQFGTLLQKAWKRTLFLLLEQLGVMESLGEQEHGMSEATLQELFLEAAYGMGYKRAQSKRRGTLVICHMKRGADIDACLGKERARTWDILLAKSNKKYAFIDTI